MGLFGGSSREEKYLDNKAKAVVNITERLITQPLLIFPDGQLFMTMSMSEGETARDEESGLAYTKDGLPALMNDDEVVLGRWKLLKNTSSAHPVLVARWLNGEDLNEGEFAQGDMGVIVTDKALRCTMTSGSVQAYGEVRRGAVCFAFRWPLEQVDWIEASKRGVGIGCDSPCGAILFAGETAPASDDFTALVSMRSKVPEFAHQVLAAATAVQIGHSDEVRRRRVQRIADGVTPVPFDRGGKPHRLWLSEPS